MMIRIIFAALQLVSWARQDNVTAQNVTSAKWKYGDEKTWSAKCQKGGPRQSPINIHTKDTMIDYGERFIKYGRLVFKGYSNVMMTGVNNGMTIQFSTEGEKMMHPVLTGGPLAHYYRLEQLHFHWMSEHAVDGIKYPLELHFVHVRADLPVRNALQTRDGLAIIAVFCNIESWAIEMDDDPLNEILDVIPMLQTERSRLSGIIFNLQKILDEGKNAYYSYAGSLTTPDCNEAVIWIIYKKPMFLSAQNYKHFLHTSNVKLNYRSLQPLRRQMVYEPRPLSIWHKTAMGEAVGGMFHNIKSFFTSLTRYPFMFCRDWKQSKLAKDLGF